MENDQQQNIPPIEEKEDLSELYKKRGLKQQGLNDYMLLKKQQDQRKKFQLPTVVKLILTTPFILLFCAGLIFIPFMIYLYLTSPSAPFPTN